MGEDLGVDMPLALMSAQVLPAVLGIDTYEPPTLDPDRD